MCYLKINLGYALYYKFYKKFKTFYFKINIENQYQNPQFNLCRKNIED